MKTEKRREKSDESEGARIWRLEIATANARKICMKEVAEQENRKKKKKMAMMGSCMVGEANKKHVTKWIGRKRIARERAYPANESLYPAGGDVVRIDTDEGKVAALAVRVRHCEVGRELGLGMTNGGIERRQGCQAGSKDTVSGVDDG